uniref:CCHC-type domain-containing protein n=1 Tax=viral metagenome TaxID=1070528 RepID=A0A6C0JQY3_9ZZZZ
MEPCRYCRKTNHSISFCPLLRCSVCGMQGHRSTKCKLEALRKQECNRDFFVIVPLSHRQK